MCLASGLLLWRGYLTFSLPIWVTVAVRHSTRFRWSLHQYKPTEATYQNAYLRFRGLVDDVMEHDKVYQHWAQQYLVDVNDETGEVVKLHESTEDLKTDIDALIHLIERTEKCAAV